jgi:hypothetical protein
MQGPAWQDDSFWLFSRFGTPSSELVSVIYDIVRSVRYRDESSLEIPTIVNRYESSAR